MNTAVKLGGFAATLAVVFGTAFGAGKFTGPAPAGPAPAADMGHTTEHDAGHDSASKSAGGEAAEHLPGGLLVTDRGYTFAPGPLAGGRFTFRILGPDGHPVTRFDTVHDKAIHLIVTRRDLSGFQHVHPQLGPDGTWQVPLALGAAGAWRAFADFTPTGGPALTLGADLDVPGDYRPVPLPAPAASTTVADYTVELTGTLQPGKASQVRLHLSRQGRPITDLQPYLGASGHLVALRQGDLAYLHVHPSGPPAGGPDITFTVEVPAAGTYRLFLDFQHRDVVRTAAFTVTTGAGDHAHN